MCSNVFQRTNWNDHQPQKSPASLRHPFPSKTSNLAEGICSCGEKKRARVKSSNHCRSIETPYLTTYGLMGCTRKRIPTFFMARPPVAWALVPTSHISPMWRLTRNPHPRRRSATCWACVPTARPSSNPGVPFVLKMC